jgi:Flp pilus assembly protein protease CpaA
LLCAAYYAHWERVLFNALSSMVLGGMHTLAHMLGARSSKKRGAAAAQRKPPLFKVRARATLCG